MWDDLARLRTGYLPDVNEQTLVLKIAEEYGEAVQAYIGVTGQNPRKGVHGTRDDVRDELADVIITAGIALVALTGDDPERARAHLGRRLRTVTDRSGV